MKSTVAIYDSHISALEAIEVLKDKCYPPDQLSLIGQAKTFSENSPQMKKDPSLKTNSSAGMLIDSTLNVLTRLRILPIGEIGFILGAGAIVTSLASSDLDITSLGVIDILKTVGVNKFETVNYSSFLKDGRFIVVAQGDEDETQKAKNILCNCAKPLGMVID